MNENEDLKAAAEAVTTLAREGAISARAAHDTWRFSLCSHGWSWGPEVDLANRQHPHLVAFDQLPKVEQIHALAMLLLSTVDLDDYAEYHDSDRFTLEDLAEVTR